jgi:hypothetical protein
VDIPVNSESAVIVDEVVALLDKHRSADTLEEKIVDWKIENMTQGEFDRLVSSYAKDESDGETVAVKLLNGLYEMSKKEAVKDEYRGRNS